MSVGFAHARHAEHEPWEDLPVAANPTGSAADIGGVGGGEVLEKLYVADQARSAIAAFQ